MRVTKTAIAGLTSDPKNAVVIWDDVLKGFGYRLYPSGQSAFVVRYRLPGSRRQRVVVVGDPAAMTIDQARIKAGDHLVAARDGRDLSLEVVERVRAAEHAADEHARRTTVSKAVAAYLMHYEEDRLTKSGRPRAPASIKAEKAWLSHILVRHGAAAFADVSSSDVKMIISGLPQGSRSAVYGAIGRLMRWGVREEIISTDPTEKIIAPAKPQARERTPSPAEVRGFLQTVEKLVVAKELKQVAADFLTLTALTGQRRSEVAKMEWADIDWKSKEWRQRAESNKTKSAHTIPLGARAMAILERRRIAVLDVGGELTGLVLPAAKGASIVGRADALMDAVRAAGVGEFNLHDLRRAMVSAMAELGVDFAVADSLLNHSASASRSGTLGVYQKAELKEPKRRAMQLWEAAIFEETAKIIPLRKEYA